MDGTGSGSCVMARFVIRGIRPSDSTIAVLTAFIIMSLIGFKLEHSKYVFLNHWL
jgi:hypothetical protein